MEISFVLVQPVTPENIGASARALSCTGFSDLRLVCPCSHLQSRARWMAKHAEGLLEAARVYTDFDEALADADLVIGTTARTRKYNQEHLFPNQIRDVLERRAQSVSRLALVFGTESRGLSNEELERCDLLTTLPMAKEGAALNLAQAVMVYAYELSQLSPEEGLRHTGRLAENPTLREQVSELLTILKIDGDPLLESRINERLALLDDRDLKLFHFLRKAVVERRE